MNEFNNATRGSEIEVAVMKQIRRIHFLRRCVGATAQKVYGSVVLLGVLASTVSISNVYANMPSMMTPGKMVMFIYTAILNTELLVQITIALLALVIVLVVRDVLQQQKQYTSPFMQA